MSTSEVSPWRVPRHSCSQCEIHVTCQIYVDIVSQTVKLAKFTQLKTHKRLYDTILVYKEAQLPFQAYAEVANCGKSTIAAKVASN